jgi:hypothetical protein
MKLDNVYVIHGFSDQVELPELCDVLVHDLIGDIGSSEGMIPFIEDAKRRYLTPESVHIPRRCTTLVALAEDPKLRLAEWAFSYGARGFRSFDSLTFVRFFGFRPAAFLSEPQVVEDFVFRETPELRTNTRLAFQIKRDGQLRGACFFLRLYVSETRVIDTLASQTSWSTPYVRFKAPISAKKGDVVELRFESELSGNPNYSLHLMRQENGALREIGQYTWSGA